MKSEIEAAMRKMKNGKATGNDKVCKEMLVVVCKLAKQIYDTGDIPTQMKQSIFITLPKKGNLLNCSNYRFISLMSHITNIILRVW